MASKTEIINIGLISIGEEPIANVSETGKNARTALAVYETLRDRLLESFPWVFAKTIAELSRLSETPGFEYSYYYQLPSDCARVLSLYGRASKYEIHATRKLATNDENVYLRYIQYVTSEGEWPSMFVTALGLSIGAMVAERLSKDKGTRDRVMNEYNVVIAEAKRLGAIQDDPDQGHGDDTDWQTAGR